MHKEYITKLDFRYAVFNPKAKIFGDPSHVRYRTFKTLKRAIIYAKKIDAHYIEVWIDTEYYHKSDGDKKWNRHGYNHEIWNTYKINY